MATGFDLLAQAGVQNAQNQAANKRMLSDDELEQKANELVDNRKAIQQKLPTLLDENNQPTAEYHQAISDLTKNAQDLRELYHPQKNPGAIQKFGHVLTDHLHITNPQDREKLADEKHAALAGQDQAEADRVAAAANPSPQQQVQAKNAALFAQIQGALSTYDKLNPHAAGPDATPEEKQAREQYRDEVIRNSQKLGSKPVYRQFLLADGKTYRSYDVSRPDLIPPGATEVLAGSQTADAKKRADYEQAKKVFEDKNPGVPFPSFEKWSATESQKPSTSVPNEIAASYAKLHGIEISDLTPADWSYLQRKTAMDKSMPTATTTTTLKQNMDGQWVPVTETNYKTPGGNITLVDPRGAATQATGSTGSSSNSHTSKPNSKKTTPQQLKKEAEARRPQPNAKTGNTSVGNPLFAAPNKQYNDTKVAYQSAIDRTKIMEKNLTNALKNHDQQAMLSLVANHIGMTLGAQKGARINQAVWNEAVESTPFLKRVAAKWGPDGYLSGVTLAPEQMRQMVELAKERTEIIKQSLDDQKKALNQGVEHPSGGSQPSSSTDDKDIDAIINALNATKK